MKHASGEVKEIRKIYRPVGQQAKNILRQVNMLVVVFKKVEKVINM